MKILSIRRARFWVGAVALEKGDGTLSCSLLDDFNEIEATYEASRDRLMSYFEQVSVTGPKALNAVQCHQVDANSKISEFISGKLRVLFFQGAQGNVVICTHMFLKKTQKTPPKELRKAVKAKRQYEQAEKVGQVEWKEEL